MQKNGSVLQICKVSQSPGLQIRVCDKKFILLFFNQKFKTEHVCLKSDFTHIQSTSAFASKDFSMSSLGPSSPPLLNLKISKNFPKFLV